MSENVCICEYVFAACLVFRFQRFLLQVTALNKSVLLVSQCGYIRIRKSCVFACLKSFLFACLYALPLLRHVLGGCVDFLSVDFSTSDACEQAQGSLSISLPLLVFSQSACCSCVFDTTVTGRNSYRCCKKCHSSL